MVPHDPLVEATLVNLTGCLLRATDMAQIRPFVLILDQLPASWPFLQSPVLRLVVKQLVALASVRVPAAVPSLDWTQRPVGVAPAQQQSCRVREPVGRPVAPRLPQRGGPVAGVQLPLKAAPLVDLTEAAVEPRPLPPSPPPPPAPEPPRPPYDVVTPPRNLSESLRLLDKALLPQSPLPSASEPSEEPCPVPSDWSTDDWAYLYERCKPMEEEQGVDAVMVPPTMSHIGKRHRSRPRGYSTAPSKDGRRRRRRLPGLRPPPESSAFDWLSDAGEPTARPAAAVPVELPESPPSSPANSDVVVVIELEKDENDQLSPDSLLPTAPSPVVENHPSPFSVEHRDSIDIIELDNASK